VPNDLDLYERHADEWWDPRSPAFRSLRNLKAYHLELVTRVMGESLRGAVIVDLGCGGGFLSVPLAERGADVFAVDISHGSLAAALAESSRRGVTCRTVRGDLRRIPIATATADLVLLSDVLEHVDDPAAALREAARIARAGGRVFVNTINRTFRARLLAVTLAEGLGLVPSGTHDPKLFITPDELRAFGANCGLRAESFHGESPRLLETIRHWTIAMKPTRNLAVTYSAFFVKDGKA
jgi:2-polyprenyl-6-hydroxyphenyl methylase/3-demethylubiquinone-9 3-methyltransferase